MKTNGNRWLPVTQGAGPAEPRVVAQPATNTSKDACIAGKPHDTSVPQLDKRRVGNWDLGGND